MSGNKTTVPAMVTQADVTKAVSEALRAVEYWLEEAGDNKTDSSARIALHSASKAVRQARYQFEDARQ